MVPNSSVIKVLDSHGTCHTTCSETFAVRVIGFHGATVTLAFRRASLPMRTNLKSKRTSEKSHISPSVLIYFTIHPLVFIRTFLKLPQSMWVENPIFGEPI